MQEVIEWFSREELNSLLAGEKLCWWSYLGSDALLTYDFSKALLVLHITEADEDVPIKDCRMPCKSSDGVNKTLSSFYYAVLQEITEIYTLTSNRRYADFIGFWRLLRPKTPTTEPAPTSTTGIKYDDGKLKYHLIPWQVLEGLASVLTFGAKLYRPNNWKLLADPEERYEDAMWRHIIEYKKGNRLDKDSKMPHLWHAITNLAFLIYFESKEDDNNSI